LRLCPQLYYNLVTWSSFTSRVSQLPNIIIRGLLNYGFLDAADMLLERWIKHTCSCIDRVGIGMSDLKDEGMANYDARSISLNDFKWIVPENWNPLTGEVHGSGGYAWGGLWVPSVIMRHFWPVGEEHVIVRPGGRFNMEWGSRWKVLIDAYECCLNGRFYKMTEDTTYLINEKTGDLRRLDPGQADPIILLL